MFSKVYFLQQRYENNLAHSVGFLVVKQLIYVHYYMSFENTEKLVCKKGDF